MTAGRPTTVTPEAITKLEHAFSLGCSDKEACFFAGISVAALYRYQENNEEFRERKALLKEKSIFEARCEVVKGIKDNPEFALKYLERKRKAEFSLRSEVANEMDGDIVIKVIDTE